MQPIARGWRRFRRLPGLVQTAVWLAVVAAYSLVLVLVLAGGDDAGDSQTGRQRAASPLEQQVKRIFEGAKINGDRNDIDRFRQPLVKSVRCEDDRCSVVYSVGLTGRGRLLQDQRGLLEELFLRTDVRRVKISVTRDTAAAGVPAKGEETPSGTLLLETDCDRSERPDVDWGSAKGAQILYNICDVEGYSQGQVVRGEAVAPDDPAIKDAPLPEQGG